MSIKNLQPLFDSTTHYRIIVQGRVAVEWLQSLESSVEMAVDTEEPMEDFTVLDVRTDQAGIVGLVRRLHGLGMTIQQFQIIP